MDIRRQFSVTGNKKLAGGIYEMRLSGDCSLIASPGQFVAMSLDGFFLRRPFSVCDVEGDELTIVYKIAGEGTKAMRALETGARLELLTGLGNGFHVDKAKTRPLVVGGGVGIPPLYYLCKMLRRKGMHPSAVLGFNKESEVFYVDEFKRLGVDTHVSALDGSVGVRGYVTDAIREIDQTAYGYYYCCGPKPMLRAVYDALSMDGELSFEERMGCGIGACMGCSVKMKSGYKTVCKDGPVFEKGEILWQS